MGDDGSGIDWTSFLQSLGGTGDPGYLTGGPSGSMVSGMIDNGDGTYTDPTSGIIYDNTGTSTGQTDPNYENAGAINPTTGNLGGNLSGGTSGTPSGGTQPGGGLGGLGALGGGLGSLLGGLGGGLGSLGGLLGILAPLLGGAYAANRTNQATNQVLAGIGNANQDIKGILGQPSLFAPYTTMGQTALGKLGGMGWTPLNYGALGGTPGGINLGMLAGARRMG